MRHALLNSSSHQLPLDAKHAELQRAAEAVVTELASLATGEQGVCKWVVVIMRTGRVIFNATIKWLTQVLAQLSLLHQPPCSLHTAGSEVLNILIPCN
jgi:hypothetical protein